MSVFIEVRALGGVHFVRPGEIVAVQYTEPQKCNLLLASGLSMSCNEPAAQVRTRIDAALQNPNEAPHGDASR